MKARRESDVAVVCYAQMKARRASDVAIVCHVQMPPARCPLGTTAGDTAIE